MDSNTSPTRDKKHKATFIKLQRDSSLRKPISTSYLQNGVELAIRINFPKVEYHNDRKEIIVSKTLSEKELERFFAHPLGFDPSWQFTALQMFTLNT